MARGGGGGGRKLARGYCYVRCCSRCSQQPDSLPVGHAARNPRHLCCCEVCRETTPSLHTRGISATAFPFSETGGEMGRKERQTDKGREGRNMWIARVCGRARVYVCVCFSRGGGRKLGGGGHALVTACVGITRMWFQPYLVNRGQEGGKEGWRQGERCAQRRRREERERERKRVINKQRKGGHENSSRKYRENIIKCK